MHVRKTSGVVSLIALAITLSACGGGGGGGGLNSTPPPILGPTPTPTPASIPTFPSASPPTTYSTLARGMSGALELEQLGGGRVRVVGLTPEVFAVGPGTNDYTITYHGPDSYSLDIHGFGGPAYNAATKGSSASDPYDQYSMSDADFSDILEVAKKNVGVELTYSSFGTYTWVHQSGAAAGKGYMSFYSAGTPTPSTQMPVSGSATYSGIADGLWYDGTTLRRLYGSAATLTANFGTGQISSTLELRGHSDPFGNFLGTPTTLLGIFTGTGTITSNYFNGAYNPTAGYSGRFGGGFVGPAANEYGLVFNLTGGANQSAVGVAVGKRN